MRNVDTGDRIIVDGQCAGFCASEDIEAHMTERCALANSVEAVMRRCGVSKRYA